MGTDKLLMSPLLPLSLTLHLEGGLQCSTRPIHEGRGGVYACLLSDAALHLHTHVTVLRADQASQRHHEARPSGSCWEQGVWVCLCCVLWGVLQVGSELIRSP